MNEPQSTPGAGASPKYEALWPENLFEMGLGWVILARFKSGGERVEVGVFLIDLKCLGVKKAHYEDCGRLDYLKRIRGHYEADYSLVSVGPECARKLVEQAAQYALGLGFSPHPDYKKAARVFGGIHAEQCSRNFTFGHEGKPLYVRGPNETEEMARRIIWQLEQRCGAGNYHYLLVSGDDDLPEGGS